MADIAGALTRKSDVASKVEPGARRVRMGRIDRFMGRKQDVTRPQYSGDKDVAYSCLRCETAIRSTVSENGAQGADLER